MAVKKVFLFVVLFAFCFSTPVYAEELILTDNAENRRPSNEVAVTNLIPFAEEIIVSSTPPLPPTGEEILVSGSEILPPTGEEILVSGTGPCPPADEDIIVSSDGPCPPFR